MIMIQRVFNYLTYIPYFTGSQNKNFIRLLNLCVRVGNFQLLFFTEKNTILNISDIKILFLYQIWCGF